MLYHGSCHLLSSLKRRQARGPPGTPKEESLNVIYFTSDFAFALAIASMSEGINIVNHEERTIHLENPDKFDPEKIVYVYLVNEKRIFEDKRICIDKSQVVADIDEIVPDGVEFHKAGEILRFYSIEGGR